jgi:hypothetical protein
LEEEKLLDELDTELGTFPTPEELSIPEEEQLLPEDEELPDISDVTESEPSEPVDLETVSEDELPELDLEEEAAPAAGAQKEKRSAAEVNEVEVTLSDSAAEQGRFEDLDALESELASVTASAAKPRPASSEILARIEDELRSIRADLTQLRGELSGMRKPRSEPSVETPPTGNEAQSGFFDEDEDETIALTGDELDNILNTADITEEEAEAAPVEEPSDLEELEEVPSAGEEQDTGLGLEGAELSLETAETPAETGVEELPTELELDDLSAETTLEPTPGSAEALPDLDIEGIPELEDAEEQTPKAGGLETLDLQETDDLELLESPEPAKDELAGDVDLDALAAEAQELESDETAAPMEDIDLAELEPVDEEVDSTAAAQTEIEIPFENEQTGNESESLALAEEVLEVEEVPPLEEAPARGPTAKERAAVIPDDLKDEIRTVLTYMDHLLEALPDEKIQEFAKSDYFVMYKKLFEDLGLGE